MIAPAVWILVILPQGKSCQLSSP